MWRFEAIWPSRWVFLKKLLRLTILSMPPTNISDLAQVQLNSAIVRTPLVVSPNTAVMDAIAQMSGIRTLCSAEKEADSQLNQVGIEARSSCVIVVEDNRLVGILTERDMVRLITQKPALENLLVCEVMTRSVITLRESAFTDLFSAVNLLQQHHIRHLPILDEHDCLVGLVTHESLQQISRPIDLLRLRLVTEVMTTEVICAPSNVTMIEIARRMSDNRVSSVVIVQQQLGKQQEALQIPIGIVTERDVVQFKALGLNLDDCQADSVMSTPIFSVQPNDSLWLVHQLMEQRFIGRLTVIGAQGQLLGIVTKSSLLQVLNPLELYKLTEILEQKVLQLEAEKVEFLENRTIKLEQQVEERTVALKAKAEQGYLIASIASQIRSSLDLQAILNTTVEKLQSILGCDRVAIWQLQPDLQLMAVAEATSGKINARLGQQVYDPCFAPNWLDAYQLGRVRVVSDIYTADLADCHRDLLEQLQTRAKVLLPIIQGNTLWGLLEATESYIPRQWHPEEVSLLEQLATQLAIAIQQATAYQQAQTELVERRQTEAHLRESEQRFVTLAAAAPVGIFRTDAKGHCVYVNERWCSIAGLTEEEAFEAGWMKGLHPSDQHSIADEWYCAAQENRPFRLEYRFQRSDGAVTWVFGQAVAERDTDGKVAGYIGTVTDISDLKQAQELIIHNALHDPLTDLPNRTLLTQRLELAVARFKHTERYRYAVLFLDLDRFKVINDSLGHLTGDQLLITIAQRLKTHLRPIDLVARLGGDEFVILLENITGIEEIIPIVERILADTQMPLMVNGYEMFTSLSIGVVVGTEDYSQASDLIRDADIAMYGAKAQGRNSYKIFNSAMHTQALHRLTLETSLRKALEQEEFIVYYQPIVDILKNKLVGFEALVRWQHPERGFISPGAFVPVAEEIGLIVPLDRWVFQTACQQLAHWKTQFADCFPLKISINLSAQDLRTANLINNIDQTLSATGLEGSSICLEVTESILIEDINQTIELLTQLRARNIQISIDDFGTGYSSLNYLHRLPADNLKIDRSFVSQMQIENRNYQVVNTIITLSSQLGLAVVAEGIETQEQLQWLQQLGCQFGQGYLFSKPLASHEIETRFLGSNGEQQE
jgi:diguanylate cyclase (GGDEF)-like protein/PAS domain S-box-containing protein